MTPAKPNIGRPSQQDPQKMLEQKQMEAKIAAQRANRIAPLSQMDRPMGPGGPAQMTRAQQQALLAKMQAERGMGGMERAGQGTGGGRPAFDRIDETGTARRPTGVNPVQKSDDFMKAMQQVGAGQVPSFMADPALVSQRSSTFGPIERAGQGTYGNIPPDLIDDFGHAREYGTLHRPTGPGIDKSDPIERAGQGTYGNIPPDLIDDFGRVSEYGTLHRPTGPGIDKSDPRFDNDVNYLMSVLNGGGPQVSPQPMGGYPGQPVLGGGPQVSPQPMGGVGPSPMLPLGAGNPAPNPYLQPIAGSGMDGDTFLGGPRTNAPTFGATVSNLFNVPNPSNPMMPNPMLQNAISGAQGATTSPRGGAGSNAAFGGTGSGAAFGGAGLPALTTPKTNPYA